MATEYDLRVVRELLEAAFGMGELDRLGFDLIRDFYSGLSPLLDKSQKVIAVVEYAERQGRVEELLSYTKEKNPHRYEQFVARLGGTRARAEGLAATAVFADVPAKPNHFVGREELMVGLVAQLVSGRNLALAAEGLPGVGKTTTAVALAYHKEVLARFKDGVLWGGLGRVPDVMTILARWAEALGGDVTNEGEPEGRRRAVANLIGQRHLLLVIDDAWEWESADLLRCGGPNCCHLLTTRNRGIAGRFAGSEQVCNVPILAEEAAFGLLEKLAPEACRVDPAGARELSKAVGGLPLAVALLGGYLADPAAPERKYSARAAREALARLSVAEQRLQLAQERLGGREGVVTLQETIEWSVADLPAETQRVFYGLGAFAPKPATFSWEAGMVVGAADEHALSVLIDRNLVEVVEGRLALHQTVAEVAAARMAGEARTRHFNCYLELVNADREDWRRIERNYEQIQWAWGKAAETPDTLELGWAVRVYQERRGLWQDYLAWANRGLRLCQENGWRRGEGILLNNIGTIYIHLGQREKALVYYDLALPIREEVGDRSGLATTLNGIASAYNLLGQWEKALDYHNRALSIRKELGNRFGIATTLNNIGSVYYRLGEWEKALDYYNRALLIVEEVNNRPGQATTLNNIGNVYIHQGEWEKALEYYNRARLIRVEVGDRSGLATTLNSIGSVYDRLRDWEKALEYYNLALPIKEEVGDWPGLASTLNNIGLAYYSLEKYEKALGYYNRARPIMEAVGNRSGLATTLNNIGSVYDHLGEWEKALEYCNLALSLREEVGDRYGESSTREWLGLLYVRAGNLEAAQKQLTKAVELARLVGRPDVKQLEADLARVEGKLRGGKG